MKLSELGEFGLIKKLQKRCPRLSPGVLAGIGDDAAVVHIPGENALITSDMMLEGVHFDLSFTTFFQLGYKFLAVNISDILAMGGGPKYFLISLGIPKGIDSGQIDEMYSGINKLAAKFNVTVIGGDTCTSVTGLILSGTVIGHTKKAVMRSGAKAGDGIYLADTTGDSAMGLALLKRSRRKVHRFSPATDRLKLIRKHLMPLPAPLKSTKNATSMIDVSDGLLIDLSHLCEKSRVGAMIYKERIPLSRELLTMAKKLGQDPFKSALEGGEDYVLLFTAPPGYRTAAHRIGEIIKKGRYIIDADGKKTPFQAEGYEHFK